MKNNAAKKYTPYLETAFRRACKKYHITGDEANIYPLFCAGALYAYSLVLDDDIDEDERAGAQVEMDNWEYEYGPLTA